MYKFSFELYKKLQRRYFNEIRRNLNNCGRAKAKQIVPMVLVHGGAGEFRDEMVPDLKKGIKMAARVGYITLQRTASVLDAVQRAVEYMEEDPIFNAGKGSVLNFVGDIRMDAAIMNGKTLDAGCVTLVRDILHPIRLARSVMHRTNHKFMAGDGVMDLAKHNGFEILPSDALITENAQRELDEFLNNLGSSKLNLKHHACGTVGAVAIDSKGNVAAATSTGGLTGKLPGRIGDSPIVGCGTLADNDSGCVSCTGVGETIMRYTLASRILAQVKYLKKPVRKATEETLEAMTSRFGDTAGVICIDRMGNFGIHFTTERMSWAYQRDKELHFGIEKNEDRMEKVELCFAENKTKNK